MEQKLHKEKCRISKKLDKVDDGPYSVRMMDAALPVHDTHYSNGVARPFSGIEDPWKSKGDGILMGFGLLSTSRFAESSFYKIKLMYLIKDLPKD